MVSLLQTGAWDGRRGLYMHRYFQHSQQALQEIQGIKFTSREIDILACILHGRGSKKIANFLSISPKTAEAHIRNIMLKLDCNSRETIIDYLEKSQEVQNLHKHYTFLMATSEMQKELEEIGKKYAGVDKPVIWTVYDQKDAVQSSFFKELKSNLELAGITCSVGKIHSKPPRDMSGVIIAPEGDEAQAWSPTHRVKLAREGVAQKPNDSELDFTDLTQGIPAFFNLLKSVYPDLDTQYHLNKVNTKLKLGASQPQTKQNKELPQGAFYFFKQKPWLAGAFVAFLFMPPLLTFTKAGEVFGISKLFESTKPVRSELPIPNEAILLHRPQLLGDIKSKLGEKQNEINVVAVVGIDGSGKSTLARRYGRLHKGDVVWEIDARSHASITRSFESLAYALGESLEDKNELANIIDLKDPFEREHRLLFFVKHRLESKPGWLLIYDNLETFNHAQEHFPHDAKNWGFGNVIITTQNENLKNSSFLAEDNVIRIGELSPQEKAFLFQSILANDPNKPLTAEEETVLEHMLIPLGVTICAYYIKNTGVSPETYLALMNENSETFSALQRQLLTDISGDAKTQYGIITVSLDKLLQTNPEFIRPLLFISLISNQDIPNYLLTHLEGETRASNFIYNLRTYSLITPSSSPLDSFTIHQNTQKIILSYLQKNGFLNKQPDIVRDVAAEFIRAMDEAGNSLDPIKMRSILSHGEQFLTHAGLLPLDLQGKAYGRLGRIYYYLGHYEQSKPHLTKSFQLLKAHYGQQHPEVAWANTYLGKVYRNQGEYLKAERFLKYSSQIYAKRKNKYPLEYAWVAGHLGNIYRSLGHFDQGLMKLEESLAIIKEHLGEDHIKAAWVSVHLASILRAQGEHEKAYTLIQNSIPIFQKKYGNNNAQTAWVETCLGRVLIDLGRLEEAQAILEKNETKYRKYYGSDHIQTAWVLRGLARLHMAKGDKLTAKNYIQESLQIMQKRHHPDLYISLELLADITNDKDTVHPYENPESQAFLEEALGIVKAHFSSDSAHIKRISNKLKGEPWK